MNNNLTNKQKNFYERISLFQKHWKESNFDQHFNFVAFLNGKDDDRAVKIKISAIYNWLFGFEFYESIVLITKNKIIIGGNEKKIQQIQNLKECEKGESVVLVTINGIEEGLKKLIQELKEEIEKGGEMKVGWLLKEKQIGELQKGWEEVVQQKGWKEVEVGGLVQESLAIKDLEEVEEMKKAARVCLHFQNKLIAEIEECIDSEKEISHLNLSLKVEKMLTSGKEQKLMEQKFSLVATSVDLSYMPIVQSGGIYDLRPQAESDKRTLSADVIMCSVGGKYNEYNANLVRTLFINASPQQRATYNHLVELQEYIIERLRANKVIAKLYEDSLAYVRAKDSHLADKLQNYFGFGMGLEFREGNLVINQKNEKALKENMVFNVCVGANDLFDQEKQQKYAIMVADTVVVGKDEGQSLTNSISKKFTQVSYQIEDEEEGMKEDKRQKQEKKKVEGEALEGTGGRYNTRKSRTAGNTNLREHEENEKKRKEHQKDLLDRKQTELEQRLHNGDFRQVEKTNTAIKAETLQTYQNQEEMKGFKKNTVAVDQKNNAVIIPIQGRLAVFHVAVIKNVSKHEEGRFVSIRFNFHVSGGGLVPVTFPEAKPQDVFIREITVRMTDFQRASEIIRKVKESQKKVKQQQQENKQQHNDLETNMEQLTLNKGKRPLMNDLKVRPNLTGKKIAGSLEAHLDGFRYTTSNRSDKLDLLYRNVKHAFFQPCDGEMIILLHFHLHRPVMVGKKKTLDVQFYTEAGIMTEDLDIRGRRANYDQDEYEQEEREKQQRKKLNQEFEQFVKAVQQFTKAYFVFDVPYKQLGFYGTPQRSQVFLKPTVNCLVSLSETPFFVMTLDEIEVAYFERIQFGLRNFDLTFVFKNYERPVVRISAIPVESLEEVKNWLNQMDILYSEGTLNLNWVMVMNQIKQDIEGFVEDGGWGAILFDDSEEEEEEEQEQEVEQEDSAFTVEEEEESAEEESEFSVEEDDNDDFESDFDEEEELSEEGLDWDEMEEITKKKEEKARKNRAK